MGYLLRWGAVLLCVLAFSGCGKDEKKAMMSPEDAERQMTILKVRFDEQLATLATQTGLMDSNVRMSGEWLTARSMVVVSRRQAMERGAEYQKFLDSYIKGNKPEKTRVQSEMDRLERIKLDPLPKQK